MFAFLERMSNQLPPRLKLLLNLAISVALVLLAVPFLWAGVAAPTWGAGWTDLSLGAGLALMGVFNLFT